VVRPGSQHLSSHQRLLVHASGWLLLATGLAWLGLHYLVGAGAGQLPHPLEAWTLRAHALAAWVGAFTLGELAASHVPRGWHTTMRRRAHTQRRLGLGLCVLAAALLLSGYALMYLVSEPSRAAWGWAHAAVGLVMTGVLIVHGSGALHRRNA
jgi:hypothetical protein